MNQENDMPYVAEPKPKNRPYGVPDPDLHHLNGVPHFEAPIPRRLHRCWVQSFGWSGFVKVERCACGAIRRCGDRRWAERNSRKRPAKPVPSTPYNERKQASLDDMDALFTDLPSSGEHGSGPHHPV